MSLSNLTTATIEFDFFPEFDSHFLIIPMDFNGVYEICSDILVFDDEEMESGEIIVYDVTPLSQFDSVVFSGNQSSIVVYVIDDDGKNSNLPH